MANNNHFNLTLDTVAPVGSIEFNNQYCNTASSHITVVPGDAAYMRLWYDATKTNPTLDNIDSNAGYIAAQWVNASTTANTNFTSNGNFYYHLVLIDSVGNRSIYTTTNQIVYDSVKPVISSVILSSNGSNTLTNNTTASVYVKFSDASPTSGCTVVSLEGNIVNSPVSYTLTGDDLKAGTCNIPVTLLSGDGIKKVTATVADAAGNVAVGVDDTITLDTTNASGTLALHRAGTSEKMPQYINSTNQKFDATISIAMASGATSHDVKGYKIWGDFGSTANSGATDKPADFTSITNTTAAIKITDRYFTSTDAVKHVYAELIDTAGNITAYSDNAGGLTKSITYDNTKPVVVLSNTTPKAQAPINYISNKIGHTTANITGTYDVNIAGFSSYSWSVNGVVLSDSSSFTYNDSIKLYTKTWDITSSGLKEGKNTFKLTVTDLAGNIGDASIDLYLDTTAPAVPTLTKSINVWHKEAFPILVNGSDNGSGMLEYQVWSSTTAADTEVPGNVKSATYTTGTSQEISTANIILGTPVQAEVANYLHVKAIDCVGNCSFAHFPYKWDSVAPSGGTITVPDTCNSSIGQVLVTCSASDATSGMSLMKIWGDIGVSSSDRTTAITEANAAWQPYNTSATVYLTNGDGYKKLYAKFKDVAGNESGQVGLSNNSNNGIELDTTTPTGTISLLNADETADLTNIVVSNAFKIKLTFADDALGDVQYRIYSKNGGVTGGDYFNTSPNQTTGLEAGSYTTITTSPLILSDTYYATNNADLTPTVKNVYVDFKDNAGNISTYSAMFTYSPLSETPEVSGDYDRLSCTHVGRHEDAATISTTKFCDEVLLDFTMKKQNIKAWKFVAYINTTEAAKGSYTDTAIGTANGSQNMTGGELKINTKQVCKLNGADYRAALGGSASVSKDGLHVVVLYVQNEAGTWSEAAKF